jgi:hypothetical protein
MTLKRREIPTHLNVEDKVFYGLSLQQFLFVMVGAAGGYGLWNQWPDLPFSPRLALSIGWVLIAVALALIRPRGRGLEEWAFVALRYLALPRQSVWRSREPDPAQWRATADRWEAFSPRVAWGASSDGHEQGETSGGRSLS